MGDEKDYIILDEDLSLNYSDKLDLHNNNQSIVIIFDNKGLNKLINYNEILKIIHANGMQNAKSESINNIKKLINLLKLTKKRANDKNVLENVKKASKNILQNFKESNKLLDLNKLQNFTEFINFLLNQNIYFI